MHNTCNYIIDLLWLAQRGLNFITVKSTEIRSKQKKKNVQNMPQKQ